MQINALHACPPLVRSHQQPLTPQLLQRRGNGLGLIDPLVLRVEPPGSGKSGDELKTLTALPR